MVLSEKVGFSEKVAVGLIEKVGPSKKVGLNEKIRPSVKNGSE